MMSTNRRAWQARFSSVLFNPVLKDLQSRWSFLFINSFTFVTTVVLLTQVPQSWEHRPPGRQRCQPHFPKSTTFSQQMPSRRPDRNPDEDQCDTVCITINWSRLCVNANVRVCQSLYIWVCVWVWMCDVFCLCFVLGFFCFHLTSRF